MFWFATEYSVKQSVIHAMKIVDERGFRSVALPLIGSGSGNRSKNWSRKLMESALETIDSKAKVIFVEYGENR